jgi:capsular exopolysaccharide synthesis family protein
LPQYELNLRDYGQIIYRRRFALIIILFSVLLGTFFYSQTLKLKYKAITTIMITERRSFSSVFMEFIGNQYGDPMLTYARTINSLPIIEEAVRQLGYAGKNATPAQITAAAGLLQGAVNAAIEPNTNLIRINVIHVNPQLTAELANKVAEVFIAENLKANSKQARKTREFISEQLIDLEKKLTESEDRLKKYKEKEAPSGIAIALQNNLMALETDKSKLSKVYTDLHPDIIKINQQIEELKSQLKKLPETELNYARFIREVEINDKLFRDLKEKLESARIAESEKIEDISLVESALVPSSAINLNKSLNYLLGIIIGLMLGLTGVFLIEQLDTSIGTIEDVEDSIKLSVLGVIPFLKIKEEKRGLMQKFWPERINKEDRIERLKSQLLVHHSSNSPIFEAYRILRTNIQVEVFKEKIQGNILLLTSSGPEEGKSITTSNLSIVFAQAGFRTLLIDADMRRSTIHSTFGLKDKEPGLSDVLKGTVTLEEAIRKFTDILMGVIGIDGALKVPGLDNLSILTSGSSSTLTTELLSSKEMAAMLKKLRGMFDLILIDTPPVMAVADATVVASETDGAILVYRVGKTARSVLLRTKMQLLGAGVKLRGLVLNNISAELEMRYNYYYNYKYYSKYYTSPEEKTKNVKKYK